MNLLLRGLLNEEEDDDEEDATDGVTEPGMEDAASVDAERMGAIRATVRRINAALPLTRVIVEAMVGCR